jgi:uncharacterized protein (TIGR00288 family)
VALFIDADNAPSSKVADVLNELDKLGTVSIRRAYGNWAHGSLHSWRKVLHEHAIQPIQQFDLIKGKNATDMAMTIDVMDVLYTKSVDVFCLMSSDSDFTPLIMRLRGEGKRVIGFGEAQSPAPFISACSTFHFVHACAKTKPNTPPTPTPTPTATPIVTPAPAKALPNAEALPGDAAVPSAVQADKPTKVHKRSRAELNADKPLRDTLLKAFSKVSISGEWIKLSNVGPKLRMINVRAHGYTKLVDLMEMIDIFEIRRVDTHPQIRLKASAIQLSAAVGA